jgi:hypothetical protein
MQKLMGRVKDRRISAAGGRRHSTGIGPAAAIGTSPTVCTAQVVDRNVTALLGAREALEKVLKEAA